MEGTRGAVETLFREEYGRILASLIRRCRDFELAEEALQDALTEACEHWPSAGMPDSPAAWIATVARNRLVDRIRQRRSREDLDARLREELERTCEEAEMVSPADEFPDEDDRLRLIFTCCHPAIAHDAQVALTLNTLCGLTTVEIARGFLVRESAMAQRLVRAKKKIREAGIPYAVPPPGLLAQRLPAVLAVIYLVFNEGYSATGGDDLVRRDLCREAIRLASVLDELMPGEAEVRGLHALMILQDARRDARLSARGELVLLDEQDRRLWDKGSIETGVRLLEEALSLGAVGPYQIQAAIAAVHSEAARAEDTDWHQITRLYDELMIRSPSAVVELNRAVAVAMDRGISAGLELVDELAERSDLDEYVYLHATRAEFLRRLGRRAEAREAYGRALELVGTAAEREFLERRLRGLHQER